MANFESRTNGLTLGHGYVKVNGKDYHVNQLMVEVTSQNQTIDGYVNVNAPTQTRIKISTNGAVIFDFMSGGFEESRS